MTGSPTIGRVDQAKPWRAYLPGPASYFVTLLALAAALYFASLPGDYFMAFLVFITIGPLCCLCVILAVLEKNSCASWRTAAGWLGMAVLGLICLALITLGVPMTSRFDLSRSALEQAAARAEAGDRAASGWIGLMPVESISREADGTTIFVVSQVRPDGGSCGFVYNRLLVPPPLDSLGRQLADGWWAFCTD